MDAFKLKSVSIRFMLAFCLVMTRFLLIPKADGIHTVLAYDQASLESRPPKQSTSVIKSPTAPRVGINNAGCNYETIQEAVDAAISGDSIQVSAGTYNEKVTINLKDLTIAGDYDSSCNTIVGGLTEIDGHTLLGTLVSITSSEVTLRDLTIRNGSGATEGGGIFLGKAAEVTLEYVGITGNDADYGGGVFLDPGTVMTGNATIISGNSASILGGGAYVKGSLTLEAGTVLQGNQAPDGGGIAASDGDITVDLSNIQSNQATAGDGKGGGIYATGNSLLSIRNSAAVSDNASFYGGGVYADGANIDLSLAFFYDNQAWAHGGGIYLTGDAALDGTAVRIGGEGAILGNDALFGKGGGVYAITSTVNLTGTQFFGNIAQSSGGGIFADNSIINLNEVEVGSPTENKHNTLSYSGHYGAGISLTDSSIATLNDTIVSSNVFSTTGLAMGGGIYIEDGSTILLENGSIVENHTPGDAYDHYGAGIYADDATVTLNNSQVISNTARWQGGGIFADYSAIINLENNAVVQDNLALEGGGIYATESTVNVNDGFFYDNQSTVDGGGLYLVNGSTFVGSGVLIGGDGTTFGNDAVDGRGGGIYASASTIDLNGSQIYANRASVSGGGIYADDTELELESVRVGGLLDDHHNIVTLGGHTGAGMFLTGGSTAILSDTVIAGNTFTTIGATYGGGVYLEDLSTLTLQNDSRVEYNLAPSTLEGGGAGLFANNAAITVDNSQVVSNTSGTTGGGIELMGGSVLSLQNYAVVSYNHADGTQGGGIYSTGANDIDIENSSLDWNWANTDGGGIFLDGGTLDTKGWWTIRWNHADGNGGGVAVTGTGDADFSVTGDEFDSIFGVNVAAGGDGGGLYTTNTDTVLMSALGGHWFNFNTNFASGSGGGAALVGGGSLDFLGHVQMTSNHANGDGGAVFLDNGSELNMTASGADVPEIEYNWADNGGGVYAITGSEIHCADSVFGHSLGGNEARDGSGGAVYLDLSALYAVNCQFLYNQAELNGGAISSHNSFVQIDSKFAACDPVLENCSLLEGNIADSDSDDNGDGGAVYLHESWFDLSHTILSKNSAFRGGGIYQATKGSESSVADSLFFKNTSWDSYGSAIGVVSGTFDMEHATLGDNTGGYAFHSDSVEVVAVYNSIAWGNTDGFGGTSSPLFDCNIDQANFVGPPLDPLFVNPGVGEDYHLSLGSPAIDACTTGSPLDLDGVQRPINGLFDMGVYEFFRFIFLPLLMR